MFCCYSQNMIVFSFEKVRRLGITVKKTLNDINDMNTSAGSFY